MDKLEKNVHDTVFDLLSDRDREWSEEETRLVGEHLFECKKCQEKWEAFDSFITSLVRENPEPFREEAQRILAEQKTNFL